MSRINPSALTSREWLGHATETYVVNQLLAALQFSNVETMASYWRTPKGTAEVDLVLRRADGSAIAAEVKSTSSLKPDDAKGILAFAKTQAMTAGYVFYNGFRSLQLSTNIWGIPIASLDGKGLMQV